jgi:hypothetical protein
VSKEFYQEISRNGSEATAGLAKTGMEGTWQAVRD